MKKTIFLLFLLVGFGYSVSAQISGGIKGGLNFANLDAETDPDGKTGYHFGGFLNIGMAGISIQPEVLFSTKGAEDIDLSYVEVPILLKKNFAKVVNIHLGPQFGFLTKAETNGVDTKDFVKGTDFSAVFGAGLDLPMGISGGVRYVLGLSDINDFDGAPEVKNKTFQVYIGYALFGN